MSVTAGTDHIHIQHYRNLVSEMKSQADYITGNSNKKRQPPLQTSNTIFRLLVLFRMNHFLPFCLQKKLKFIIFINFHSYLQCTKF